MNPESLQYNSNKALIKACIERDQKAQFEVYKLYFQALFNVSLRIVNNRMEAEDIMQESFLAAFEKIEQFQGNVSFGAWLKKIVINRSLDFLKKKKIEFADIDKAVSSSESINEQFDNIEEAEYEAIQKVEEVKTAMAKLAEGFRLVINLHLIEEIEFDEIAEMLNISPSTVRSQYARGRKKLLEILQENKTIYQNGYA